MAQHDMNIANALFPSVRADINNALEALATNSSGTSGPGTTYPHQFWYDETNERLMFRNSANSDWIVFSQYNASSGVFFGQGQMTQVDHWFLTADRSSNGVISTNLSRVNLSGFARVGGGMSVTSGVFSFPETGVYEVNVSTLINIDDRGTAEIETEVTLNDTDYTTVTTARASSNADNSNSVSVGASSTYLLGVTDISNVKVRFSVNNLEGGEYVLGDPTVIRTGFLFKRIGDV